MKFAILIKGTKNIVNPKKYIKNLKINLLFKL
jgi:hypothetical protein